MVFSVALKGVAFRQDISSLDKMFTDQASTYAILRYAYDIPDSIYKIAMNLLSTDINEITNKKLLKLVQSYIGINKVGLVMDEELVETLTIPVGQAMIFEDNKYGIKLMIEETDED